MRGVIRDFNRHAPFLKTAEGRLKGASILEFLSDAGERPFLERVGAAASGVEIDARALLKSGDGDCIRVMSRASPIRDQDGLCTGVLWLIRADEGAGPDGGVREKLDLLDGVLDNSRALICVKDISGRYISANRLAEKTLDGEHHRRDPYDIFPRTRPGARPRQKVMDAGVPMEFEEVVEVDGEKRLPLDKIPDPRPRRDNRGVRISTDVTARKGRRADHGHQALKAVMDNSKAVMDIKDSRYLLVNRRFERYPDAPEGDNGQVPVRPIQRIAGRLLSATESHLRKADGFEEEIMLANGPHTFITRKFPIFDSGGDVRAVCGVSSDITGLKRAEEALEESEARFRQFFEHSPDAQFIFRRGASRIKDANPAAERLFGRSREDFISKGPALFLAGAELSRFDGAMSGARDAGLSIDRLCAGKDGVGATVSVKGGR